MKKTVLLTSIIISMLFVSCELGNFDFQDNPNELTPDAVSPDFLLNEIQIQFQQFMREFTRNTDDLMRYEAMRDTYTDIAEASVLNFEWSVFYGMKNNLAVLEGIAENDDQLRFHRGIGKVLTGYVAATLVDYIGDIPYTEANNPVEFTNPGVDSGESIYNAVLADIDDAIVDFNAGTPAPLNDLYYGGDAQKWIKFARTVKLRLLIQTRLVNSVTTEINSLISGGDLILSGNDDFQFQYSTEVEPDSRHFYFERGYSTNGANEYMGNYFLWLLKDSKANIDPRIRYYVYRQSNEDFVATQIVRCVGDPNFDFCYIGDFYLGKDHGDTQPSPNDRFLKTTYGIYPGGGSFDADNFEAAQSSSNLGGAGILPLLTSSIVKFLMVESAITLGTTGDPATLLEDAIRDSMNKVLNFASVDAAFAATSTDVDNYVAEVMTNYAAATTDAERLDIVITEKYLAGFGNSVEAYNTYRRTGYPSNIQIPIENENTPFPRTYFYPEDAINTNSSLEQKMHTVQVFWDNNPAGFIN